MSMVLPFWITNEEERMSNTEVNNSRSKIYVVGQGKEGEKNYEWVRTGYLKDGKLVSILELEELP